MEFTDATGAIFSTIVLAGGNGCGKTVLLDALQSIFEWAFPAFSYEIEIVLNAINKAELERGLGQGSLQDVVTIKYTRKADNDWNSYILGWTQESGPASQSITSLRPDRAKLIFRSFFSETQINFKVDRIDAIRSSTLDNPDAISTRSTGDLAREIGQLLVDIRAADNEDLNEWVQSNPNALVPGEVQQKRMRRFLAAFERMFPAKKFKRIDRSTTEIKVIFEEFGRESTLDQLSTGEKQIVFRAGFFLRNLERVLSSVVLIDEPELSLHPEWQARVAEFYQTLLTANGRQPQLFIATHSPFVVHGAPNAKVIILEKDQFGKIRQMPQPSYPTVGAEAAIRAFNIDAFLNAAKYPLLVLVEGESDVAIISEAWEKLYPNEPKFFEIRAALGDKNIGITLNDGLLFAKLGNRKIVGLFDFDEGYNQWNGVWRKSHDLITADESAGALRKAKAGPGWAMLLPVPAHRNGYASLVLGGDSILSIEFMFFDSDIPTAWVRDVAKPLGKTEPQFVQSHKMDFAAHVKALAQPSFVAFKPLFDRLRQINR